MEDYVFQFLHKNLNLLNINVHVLIHMEQKISKNE